MELFFLSKNYSKNWTLLKWLIELNLFLWTSFQYDSKRWSFFPIWLKDLNFFPKMSQRIEPLFHMNFFKWIKELNLFCYQYDSIFSKKSTQRFETFCWIMTQRAEFFFWIWLKDLIFWTWLKELNFFFQIDWKNGTLFWKKKKRFKQLNFSHQNNSKIRLKGLNLFQYDSKILNTFQRVELTFVWIRRKESIPFF